MQGAHSQQNINGQRDTQTTDPHKPEQKASSSLGQRLLTALVAIPLVLLFAWFGGWAAFAATLVVVILGTLELHNMVMHAGHRPLIGISFALCVLFLLSAMFPLQRLLILEIGLGAFLAISLGWILFRQKLDGALIDWALTFARPLYLGWSMSYFLLLRGYESCRVLFSGGTWSIWLPPGAWWLLVTLMGVWGFDAAAFFAGRYFGRHKLAPAISPAKTWEGALGGLPVPIVAALLFTVGPLGVPWYLAIVLGILIALAATIGDLAESLIKRQTHVKDSGQFMPGHGGMLDRLDSLLFAVIVVYLFSLLFIR